MKTLMLLVCLLVCIETTSAESPRYFYSLPTNEVSAFVENLVRSP